MWLPNVSVSTTRRAGHRKRGRRTSAEPPEVVTVVKMCRKSRLHHIDRHLKNQLIEWVTVNFYVPRKCDKTPCGQIGKKNKTFIQHSPNNNCSSLNQHFHPFTKKGRINFNIAVVDYRRRNNNSASTSAQRGANPLLTCTPVAPLSPPHPLTSPSWMLTLAGSPLSLLAPRHPPSTGSESCQTFCEAVMCPSGFGFKLPLVCAHSIKKLRWSICLTHSTIQRRSREQGKKRRRGWDRLQGRGSSPPPLSPPPLITPLPKPWLRSSKKKNLPQRWNWGPLVLFGLFKKKKKTTYRALFNRWVYHCWLLTEAVGGWVSPFLAFSSTPQPFINA